jgi:hypothetical protein
LVFCPVVADPVDGAVVVTRGGLLSEGVTAGAVVTGAVGVTVVFGVTGADAEALGAAGAGGAAG